MLAISTTYLEDLSFEDLGLLTQVLSLPLGENPTQNWLTDQANRISTFPPSLQRPSTLLYRMPSSRKAPLCQGHKNLNSHIIHEIFLQISAECTTRLQRLIEHPNNPERVLISLKRMQRINSLWMSPSVYHAIFPEFVQHDLYKHIPSSCEACILAAVGGNHQILSDLLVSMRGRRKKQSSSPPPPPLMRVVRAWLDWTDDGTALKAAAEKLGMRICTHRKKMQKVRRAILFDEVRTEVGYEQQCDYIYQKDPEEDNAAENSIADFYGSRLTLTSLPFHCNSVELEDTHPLIRDSIVFEPTTGTWKRNDMAYTESVYSNIYGPAGSMMSGPDVTATERAKTYRKLVGIDIDVTEFIHPRTGWRENWGFT